MKDQYRRKNKINPFVNVKDCDVVVAVVVAAGAAGAAAGIVVVDADPEFLPSETNPGHLARCSGSMAAGHP
jgi:hypothetical protein